MIGQHTRKERSRRQEQGLGMCACAEKTQLLIIINGRRHAAADHREGCTEVQYLEATRQGEITTTVTDWWRNQKEKTATATTYRERTGNPGPDLICEFRMCNLNVLGHGTFRVSYLLSPIIGRYVFAHGTRLGVFLDF